MSLFYLTDKERQIERERQRVIELFGVIAPRLSFAAHVPSALALMARGPETRITKALRELVRALDEASARKC